jgi:adenosylhomocysteine nucleosidase
VLTFLFPSLAEVPPSLKKICVRGQTIYRGDGWQILCTGGGTAVGEAIERYSHEMRGSLLVLLGYAGALRAELKAGELVVCKELRRRGKPPLHAAAASHKLQEFLASRGLPVRGGVSYTVERVVSEPRVKAQLAQKGGTVVEMENYLAAEEAVRLGLPFYCVRIVLDRAGEKLPDFMDTLTPQGEISFSATLRHLRRFPRHILPMLQVGWLNLALASRLEQTWQIICLWERQKKS